MNSKTTALFAVALTVAIAATAALAGFDIGGAEAKPEIVKLERVVITAKRAEMTQVAKIEKLPRVVIEGRRADAPVQVARASCTAPAVC